MKLKQWRYPALLSPHIPLPRQLLHLAVHLQGHEPRESFADRTLPSYCEFINEMWFAIIESGDGAGVGKGLLVVREMYVIGEVVGRGKDMGLTRLD